MKPMGVQPVNTTTIHIYTDIYSMQSESTIIDISDVVRISISPHNITTTTTSLLKTFQIYILNELKTIVIQGL